MTERSPLPALGLVLRSVEAVRNLRALYVLAGTFAAAGLLLASAEASFAKDSGWWGPAQAFVALVIAFYGSNAAGLLVMDDSRGIRIREIPEALHAALRTAHRLLLALLLVAVIVALMGAGVAGVFWLSRSSVLGGYAGPVLFGLAVPLGVLVIGTTALALGAVVVPLAAPAVWSGLGAGQVVASLYRLMRRRLLGVVLLMSAVGLLTALMGALVAFVVRIGGMAVAELGVRVVGVDVPAQQLMAGLFGYGLRSLGASGAPAGSTGHAAAALVGGGVVFVLALLLPGLVYLRGACVVYLAMTDEAG